MHVEEVNPYDDSASKGEQVERMFDSIAPRYDLMNTAMSWGQHKRWRDKAIKAALSQVSDKSGMPETDSKKDLRFLDVATGTGDVAFRLHQLMPSAYITGVDISEGMLEIARKKLEEMPVESRKLIAFGKGDSMAMPFHDGEFNLVTVAYGVRNFSHLRQGIKEMRRVLAHGGVLCIIELSVPTGKLTGTLYRLYSGKLIPMIGKWVSGDSRAYSYLPESIAACPQREDMAALLRAEGFSHVEWKSLSFGALTYYIAR